MLHSARRSGVTPPPSSDDFERERARRRLLNFTTYVNPNYEVNWHHRIICEELELWFQGVNPRLMLCMPPRHGKSELGSRNLPAYILGREPDAKIMATSCGAELAEGMNRDVQRIMDSEEYQRLFPQTSLSGKNVRTMAHGSYLRNSYIFEVVGRAGAYVSTGIGGNIMGRGFKYGIIDDPYRNRKDANSQTIRAAISDWYKSTFYTRGTFDARILIIMTRWHESDLVGELLDLQKSDPRADQWRLISFPAVYEGERDDRHERDDRQLDEPLWAERFGTDVLATRKVVLGSYEWASLFQQRPSPAEGAIFLRSWWEPWTKMPDLYLFEEIIQSWDCTFKNTDGTDYVVGQVWGRRGADRYLLDQVRDRMDFPETIKAIKKLKANWPSTTAIYIEDKANGPAVISTLKHDIPGLIPVEPQGGKVVRAQAVTAQIESGNVYIPSPEVCAWVGDYIEEFAAFPNGKHDDQVDATTQALLQMSQKKKAQLIERPDWI